jgi:hypothetical protein
MYVYMLKVLHNEWNIDLILRLQKCNVVKTKYNLARYLKYYKHHAMKTSFLCRRVTYNAHFEIE